MWDRSRGRAGCRYHVKNSGGRDMGMGIRRFSCGMVGACFAMSLLPFAGHAEIFKWVDAKGQTHYSERKEDAGKAKPEELKVKSQPASIQAPGSSRPDWREQEQQLQQRQAQKLRESAAQEAVAARPKSMSGGRSDDSPASKCNLARDVLSGAVRHSNGAPTDKYDLDVAKNDVSTFCR